MALRGFVAVFSAAVLLTALMAGPAPAFEVEMANWLVVDTDTSSCPEGRVFLIRRDECQQNNPGPQDDREDLCSAQYYAPEAALRSYDGDWVVEVGALVYELSMGDVTYDFEPYNHATDSPQYPDRDCAQAVEFTSGKGHQGKNGEDYQRTSFSYYVFDLRYARGCEVESATLSFDVSPWYSSCAQPDPVTTHLGLYDMLHSCENAVQDPKRGCRAALAPGPGNPLQFDFPLPHWGDYESFAYDVTASVQADLTDPDGTGYVGLILASDDMASAPGVRTLGMTHFELDVELGECSPLACTDDMYGVCLNNGRFRVEADWRDFDDVSGRAKANRLSSDSAYFTFFDDANAEVFLKVLDACGLEPSHNFWVFDTHLSNVEFTIRVTDTQTGQVRTITNPLGHTAPSVLGTDTIFTECGDGDGTGLPATEVIDTTTIESGTPVVEEHEDPTVIGDCVENATTMCLANGRFRVHATFEDFQNNVGDAKQWRLTSDSGYATFFEDSNVELFMKVLDTCAWSGSYWVFLSGLSNVGVEVYVEDTVNGKVWHASNAVGTVFPTALDTNTIFTDCGGK